MIEGKKVCAIIAAAGMGKRMKHSINKQFLEIDNKPILAHTIDKIENSKYVDYIILLIKQNDIHYLGEIINKYKISLPYKIVYGGEERQDSINNALNHMPDDFDIVLTHDGARPFVDVAKIDLAIETALTSGACCLANKVKDTIKVSYNGKQVAYTPNRSELFAVQTPQVFQKDILLAAYKQAYNENYYGTDDCSLVEKYGKKIELVLNDYKNIKITTPEDLIIAEALVEEN